MRRQVIEIDGSMGEGGGQVLRTSLSLSCILLRPFRMVNIRKNRRKPGLAPQHLMAVRAAAALSGAEVRGDAQRSEELEFSPRQVDGGRYDFPIGTAGASSLVIQTVLPPLLLSAASSRVTVSGGTHVPMSPSATYLQEVFFPTLRKCGADASFGVESYGFYPKGGGAVGASLRPSVPRPLALEERGRLLRVHGVSAVANLPLHIALRQRQAALEILLPRLREVPVEIALQEVKSPGQGTFTFLVAQSGHSLAGFISLGERGKRAEAVGEEGARELLAHLALPGALDPHLADQLVLYLALAPGRSVFTTSCVTRHLLTNLQVVQMFHPYEYAVEGEEGSPGRVVIEGRKA